MVLLVCGSRDWDDPERIAAAIDRHAPDLVVQGGASGADTLAKRYCDAVGIHCATIPALWKHYGKAAGPKRNRAMLLVRPDRVIAFPVEQSRGTLDMIAAAKAEGIPVEIIR